MSDMKDWAKREIELACKKENPDRKEGEFDYGCSCYESAYRAFECLLGDEHSGMSIGITKNILNRLIDGKPLTPIEDTENVWNECHRGKDRESTTYQNKRRSSLFKDVHTNGTITYTDVNRYYCVDICSENSPVY